MTSGRRDSFPWFWVVLGLLIVIAAIPRFLSCDYSLPYVDHPDEPNKYLAAQVWRGLYEHPSEEYYKGYPPGYLVVSYLAQVIGEPLGINGLAETVRLLRHVAVIVNLGTMLLIGLAARRAGGDLAGWIAAALWGVSPLVLEVGYYAIQDPFIYFWVTLALWLAIEAWIDESRRHWMLWSVAVGIVAILFKYPVITAVGPGLLVALIYTIRDRRKNLRYLVAGVVPTIAVGLWMIPQIQAMEKWQRHAGDATSNIFQNLFNVGKVANNLFYTFIPIGAVIALVIVGLGGLAYWYASRSESKRIDRGTVVLALLLVISIPWLAAIFAQVSLERIKDVLPATAAACVLVGAAVAQIVYIVPERWRSIGQVVIPLAAVLPIMIPQTQADWELVAERMPPDRRVAIREWFDTNLEAGTVIVTYENEKTFNPFWGGLQGRQWFDWWRTEDIMEYSVEEWRDERYMAYAILPRWKVEAMEATEDGQDYFGQMLHLRDFYAPPEMRGPEVAVYRLWKMQHEVDIRFGDMITLQGYDISTVEARPGDVVTLRFYWQATSTPPENYSLFVHLMPADEVRVITQADGNPAVPERLTRTWDEPTEILISPEFALTIPEGTPPGDYRLLVGLYNFETGVRLPVGDGAFGSVGDSYEIPIVIVE
ncbi:MAG: glycosyltransferase family 39 protein [Anaerolineae bacterium]|nr:glycosyltransferase family 39 protein [Anaerolineae bacterium]